MGRPSKYPQEFRERAVRLVLEQRDEYRSEFEAIRSVAAKLGVGSPETVRKWVRRAEVDAGARPGLTSAEHEQIKPLKRENAELHRANGCDSLSVPGSGTKATCAPAGRVIVGAVTHLQCDLHAQLRWPAGARCAPFFGRRCGFQRDSEPDRTDGQCHGDPRLP